MNTLLQALSALKPGENLEHVLLEVNRNDRGHFTSTLQRESIWFCFWLGV
jgi:hypothetical protein